MIDWLRDRIASFADAEIASLMRERRKLRSLVKALEQTNAEIAAKIHSKSEELSGVREVLDRRDVEIDHQEQLLAIKDDIIRELRVGLEEVQAAQEKRIAMHERARILAQRGEKLPEPMADDFIP